VSHWNALNDAAYLPHLVAMSDVQLVGVQDSDPGLVARRTAEAGGPSTFTDYRQMLGSMIASSGILMEFMKFTTLL
jgi:predicted dehydrogenase